MIGLIFIGYVAISATIVFTITYSVINENKNKSTKKEKNIPNIPDLPTPKNKKIDLRYNVEYILEQKNKAPNKTHYYNNEYDPKINIKTNNQFKFYNSLIEVSRQMDFVVFSKAVLKNVLEKSYYNKISAQKNLYVLVSIIDYKIALCIDLYNPKLIDITKNKRDEVMDMVFYDLDIKLLKYPVSKEYYSVDLKNEILEILNR